MKNNAFCIFLAALLFHGLAILVHGAELSSHLLSKETELYWISYLAFADSGKPTGAFHLMQIDSNGSIVRSPKALFLANRFIASGTALAHANKNTINLWTVGNNGVIIRTNVDKTALRLNSKTITKAATIPFAFAHISVTQKGCDDFLSAQAPRMDGEVLRAHPISTNGAFEPFPWNLTAEFPIFGSTPICATGGCSGGVSSDGTTAFYVQSRKDIETELVLQPLNHGRPDRPPQTLVKVGAILGGVRIPDVTNLLPDGTKIVAYILSPDSPGSIRPDRLLLQRINGITAAPIGEPVFVNQSLDLGDVAIEPNGHFLLFVIYQSQSAVRGLVFQALDTLGHPSGGLRPITSNVFSGLDLLKD